MKVLLFNIYFEWYDFLGFNTLLTIFDGMCAAELILNCSCLLCGTYLRVGGTYLNFGHDKEIFFLSGIFSTKVIIYIN